MLHQPLAQFLGGGDVRDDLVIFQTAGFYMDSRLKHTVQIQLTVCGQRLAQMVVPGRPHRINGLRQPIQLLKCGLIVQLSILEMPAKAGDSTVNIGDEEAVTRLALCADRLHLPVDLLQRHWQRYLFPHSGSIGYMKCQHDSPPIWGPCCSCSTGSSRINSSSVSSP